MELAIHKVSPFLQGIAHVQHKRYEMYPKSEPFSNKSSAHLAFSKYELCDSNVKNNDTG